MGVDWDSNVLSPLMSVFGEPVTYTPASGSSFPLGGVFDEAYQGIVLLGDDPAMTTVSPILGVRLDEFPSGVLPRKGDTVAIPSVNTIYTIKDVRPDGHGHAKLMLNIKSAMS